MASIPVRSRPERTTTSHPPPVRRGVEGEDGALAAEAPGELVEELGPRHRGGVGRDLVGAGLEQRLGIGDLAHAAADGERQRKDLANRAHHLEGVTAALGGGADIEDDELVGALFGVGGGELHRIAGVAQPLELDALDDPAVLDIETRNDPRQQHQTASPAAASQRSTRA